MKLGNENSTTFQGMLPASLLISFPGLFKITISSRISNTLFLNVCGGCQEVSAL